MRLDKAMALPDALRAMVWAMDAFHQRNGCMESARRWPESRSDFVLFARKSNWNGVHFLKRAREYAAVKVSP